MVAIVEAAVAVVALWWWWSTLWWWWLADLVFAGGCEAVVVVGSCDVVADLVFAGMFGSQHYPQAAFPSTFSSSLHSRRHALNCTLDSARIKVYDHQDDTWKVIEGDIPINDNSESPYLLAGFLGKLHVITKDANHNIMVMQADRQNHSVPSPSTSTNSLQKTLHEVPEPVLGSEANMWRVVALRSGGSAELVSCQILDV
ncbi:hypothetical protein K7X08_009050 [Anisodus acutangulus]|uniref:Uncharacterized protein n=1 Tax=Anisodus acutangulus TaxID=402998 RepID=A0A9Q1RT47_9SOLA|nr:hypothetical protein K7X08_009050 [Anisodus acutangulus]